MNRWQKVLPVNRAWLNWCVETNSSRTGRYFVTSARDILLGLNKGNEKKLGDWGFVVDDSPTPAKTKKPM